VPGYAAFRKLLPCCRVSGVGCRVSGDERAYAACPLYGKASDIARRLMSQMKPASTLGSVRGCSVMGIPTAILGRSQSHASGIRNPAT
jgi:hypothetical protein